MHIGDLCIELTADLYEQFITYLLYTDRNFLNIFEVVNVRLIRA